MLFFRSNTAQSEPRGDLNALLEQILAPGNFFVCPGLCLERGFQADGEIPWELFRGRLLTASQTRQRRSFDSWDIYVSPPDTPRASPMLSVKLDRASAQLHVTRAIECYAWEPYDAGGNVILTREARQWIPELVGTIELERFQDPVSLRDELIALLFQAVVGCSRLPLTSSEAPLPAFTLGQLAYFLREGSGPDPLRSHSESLEHALQPELSWIEKTKLIEFLLRATPEQQLPELTDLLVARWREIGHTERELFSLLRSVFNEVALSPYTDLVNKFLKLLQLLVVRGHASPADLIDFLSYLLRQLGRHLTAYDLVTFHHRGANYPDALLLDAALKLYLRLIEQHPTLFLGTASEADRPHRLRRRALRQAWLVRRRCEGLPVPAQPTSPGENLRVMPPPFVRIPDEQITDPPRRSHRLYEEDPLGAHVGPVAQEVLGQSLADLQDIGELRELGMAIFLDRPLGIFKAPGEPDQTLLLSCVAFSLLVAEERLRYLAGEGGTICGPSDPQAWIERLRVCSPKGLTLGPAAPRTHRPGVVSLRDAVRVSPDFVFLRSTAQSVRELLRQFDFSQVRTRFDLAYLDPSKRVLILPDESQHPGVLRIYDDSLRPGLELEVDPSQGYRCRAGCEFPAAGLRVLRVWEADEERIQGVLVPPSAKR
jgi:hypothetical protein